MKRANGNLPPRKRIQDFSLEELEREVKERKNPKVPTPIPEPDFTKVKAAIVEGIKDLRETGNEDEDFEHFVFETAFEAVYGKDGWKWYNQLLRQ